MNNPEKILELPVSKPREQESQSRSRSREREREELRMREKILEEQILEE